MEKDNEKEVNMKVYEVSYLLLPSLAEEQVPAIVQSIKDSIKSAGGEIVSGEDPILIDLAYTMTKVVQTQRYKCDAGYFGWTKFELPVGAAEEVKKWLDSNPDILRYLLINTVKENTLINGKMSLKREDSKKNNISDDEISSDGVDPLEEEDSSSEEIDKSIDDLVIS